MFEVEVMVSFNVYALLICLFKYSRADELNLLLLRYCGITNNVRKL